MAHRMGVAEVAGRLVGAAIGGCVDYYVFGWS